MKRVYLDSAAASEVSTRALRVFVRALAQKGNPGAFHEEGRASLKILEDARRTIASIVGVKTDAVIFTASATEANNLAIMGVVENLHATGRSYESMHILYADGAHASTTQVLTALQNRGVQVTAIPFVDGTLDLEWVRTHVTDHTVLVCLESVASETGARTNTKDVRRVLDKHAPKVLLHVDASQSPYVEHIEREHFGADTLVFDAQKVGGVRGIGALILSSRAHLAPVLFGGGQEKGIRPGTPSPAHAAAFACALEESQQLRPGFVARALRMRQSLINTVTDAVANVVVNEGKENAPHIVNFSCVGRDTDYLVALLNEAGFSVSTKSACESLSEEGSRGVLALTKDPARAATTLRVSWGPTTKQQDIARFAKVLIAEIAFIDRA